MSIDFPNSPSNGDTYSYSGETYRYNGVAWVRVRDRVTTFNGATGAIVGVSSVNGLTGSVTLKPSGFEFEIEVLAKYLNDNTKITEVPIHYNGRSYAEGKKIKPIDGLKYIYWMLKCKE